MRMLSIAGLAAAVLLSGCSTKYLLVSQFVASSQAEPPPEIIETPTYRAEVGRIKTVAVRAPESCSDRTADSASGAAASQETILKTYCGVEMAEIERGLARLGYRVISWKVLSREMNERNLTAIEIASNLGAEALFQINSLEKSRNAPGKDARWERKYFRSNDLGERVQEQPFDDDTRAFFKNRYFDRYEKSADYRRLAITLDANAVLVKTAESIWYYRWTHSDPVGLNLSQEVLVECEGNNRECVTLTPRKPAPDRATTRASGDSEAISASERPEDREKAVYAQLLSDVITSLVKSFSRGRDLDTDAPIE
jgi:hypothetical protein